MNKRKAKERTKNIWDTENISNEIQYLNQPYQ